MAEVLITLGIIGVVAAMTLPTLVQNYKRHEVETRLAKFNSVINQAIRRSEVDNGEVKYWSKLEQNSIFENDVDVAEYSSTDTLEWFNRYFKPYLNIARISNANSREGAILVYFTDGSLVSVSPNSWIFYPEAKNFIMVEGNNGVKYRKAEDSGIKWFTFFFYPSYGNGGVYPYRQPNNHTDEYIRTNNAIGCIAAVPTSERALCTLMIARNGWKIPKNYPLKF